MRQESSLFNSRGWPWLHTFGVSEFGSFVNQYIIYNFYSLVKLYKYHIISIIQLHHCTANSLYIVCSGSVSLLSLGVPGHIGTLLCHFVRSLPDQYKTRRLLEVDSEFVGLRLQALSLGWGMAAWTRPALLCWLQPANQDSYQFSSVCQWKCWHVADRVWMGSAKCSKPPLWVSAHSSSYCFRFQISFEINSVVSIAVSHFWYILYIHRECQITFVPNSSPMRWHIVFVLLDWIPLFL